MQMSASDGKRESNMNYTAIIEGMTGLIEGLKKAKWPNAFFEDLLGLKADSADYLPKYAFWFLLIYAIAAMLSLILHYIKKQKCFSDFARKFMDCVCLIVGVMCGWIIPQFIAQGKVLAAEVEGSFSFTPEGLTWLSDFLQAWFDPIWLGVLFLGIAIMPILTIKRYLKEYKLLGIPWAIYDVGFGVICLAAAILSMASGSFLWYLTIPVAMLLISFGQKGGVDLV